jgi:hypothetical protein
VKISNLFPDYAVLDKTQPDIERQDSEAYYWGEVIEAEYALTYTVQFVVGEAELKKILGD